MIRCSMQEFKLSERPSYTALSYVWEDYGPKINLQTTEEKEKQKAKLKGKGKGEKPELDPKEKRTIICNGKHLQVGASLFAALTGLRKELNDGYIWIDAICINQEDEREQSAQVAKMTTTYGGADFLFIWLGSRHTARDTAVVWLENIPKYPSLLRIFPSSTEGRSFPPPRNSS